MRSRSRRESVKTFFVVLFAILFALAFGIAIAIPAIINLELKIKLIEYLSR